MLKQNKFLYLLRYMSKSIQVHRIPMLLEHPIHIIIGFLQLPYNNKQNK